MFDPQPQKIALLRALGVSDVPTLLDIFSKNPLPLYGKIRMNKLVLLHYGNELIADFDTRFILLYIVLSGIYTFLRDVGLVPQDKDVYFTGTIRKSYFPGKSTAEKYLMGRSFNMEKELRTISFFCQHFDYRVKHGDFHYKNIMSYYENHHKFPPDNEQRSLNLIPPLRYCLVT
jgi:hypothetical protein